MRKIFRYLQIIALVVILILVDSFPASATTITLGYTGARSTVTSGQNTWILSSIHSGYEGTITSVQFYMYAGTINNRRFFTAYNSTGSTWVVRDSVTVSGSGYTSEGLKKYTVSLHCHVNDCLGWSSDYSASTLATRYQPGIMIKVVGEYSDIGDSASYSAYNYCMVYFGGEGPARVILTVDSVTGSNVTTIDNVDWTIVKSVDGI